MITLVCAHMAEAKPLVQHFRLTKDDSAKHYPGYKNPDSGIVLIVTGNGKLAAAANCMSHATQSNLSRFDAWLNVGIAGHASRAIGEPVVVDKCIDAGSQQCWYPQFVFSFTAATDHCITVDRPQDDYTHALVDMELSGIMSVATRFTTLELIHSVKIVSDNTAHPHTQFNRNDTDKLITASLPTVEILVNELSSISHEMSKTLDYRHLLPGLHDRWHFTETEKHQLEQLISRWHCLLPDDDPLLAVAQEETAAAVLRSLHGRLEKTPPGIVQGHHD